MSDRVEDGRKGRFWMDDEVIDRFGAVLGVHGLAVYVLLCRRAGKNGSSFPSVRRIATDLGMSERQAKRELKKLRDLSLIAISTRRDESGRQQSSVYTVLEVPSDSEALCVQGDSETPGGEGSVSHPKEDTESKEVTKEVVTNVPTSFGDGQKSSTLAKPKNSVAAPSKPVSAKSYGITRLMDCVKAAKNEGKEPTPPDEPYKRRHGDIYAAHLADGYEVEDLDSALDYLVQIACGEGSGWLQGKKRWIPLVDAIAHVESLKPAGRAAPNDERHLRLVKENEAMLANLLKDMNYA